MEPPLLAIDGLSVIRNRTPVLRGISWRICRGERWVIMGGNGSGKTSLLNALTGLLTPTAGEIRLLGNTYGLADWQALRREIGVVSSSVRQQINDDETGCEIIASGRYGQINFWGALRAADRTAALRMARRLGAEQVLDRPWAVHTQGDRQRVLIGRALLAKPRLLILDEPCAGLDPAAREQFLHFLNAFALRHGAPLLVLVTHHVEEITPAFTHVLGLKKGRVFCSGTKAETLCSRTLSGLFSAAVAVTVDGGRYRLAFTPKSSRRFC